VFEIAGEIARSSVARRVLFAARMRYSHRLILSLSIALVACDSSKGGDPGTDDGGGGGDAGGCQGLACFQVVCPGGRPGATTLSGTVYAPNGTLPLYNATVYVPNGTVAPFPAGVSCDRCNAPLSGDPLVVTTTDSAGHFVLENVPATHDVPLVIQVGRWRRQLIIPAVTACVDAPLGAEETRLPRNQGEGDIPLMALTTGGADALECLLRKVGIDDAEFTSGEGAGRVHLYAGAGGTDRFAGGASLGGAKAFWSSLDHLSRYDVVFLSCEGDQNPDSKPPEALQAMHDYTSKGGRVFASHWHNYWLQAGPAPWPTTVTFDFKDDLNDIDADVDTTGATGHALAEWLLNVGGSTALGKIAITAAQHTVTGVNPALAERLIYKDVTANGAPSVQYMTFTTPLTVDQSMRCGKFVFSDIHVSSGDKSAPNRPFPTGCTSTGLTPQEKTLAFMIFDIASCVGPPIGKAAPGAACGAGAAR